MTILGIYKATQESELSLEMWTQSPWASWRLIWPSDQSRHCSRILCFTCEGTEWYSVPLLWSHLHTLKRDRVLNYEPYFQQFLRYGSSDSSSVFDGNDWWGASPAPRGSALSALSRGHVALLRGPKASRRRFRQHSSPPHASPKWKDQYFPSVCPNSQHWWKVPGSGSFENTQ